MVWGAPVREALINNCELRDKIGSNVIKDVEIDGISYTLVFITHPSCPCFNKYREREFAVFQEEKEQIKNNKSNDSTNPEMKTPTPAVNHECENTTKSKQAKAKCNDATRHTNSPRQNLGNRMKKKKKNT